MLKISDYLYIDKKHVVKQIIEDLLKSIDVDLEINYLTKKDDFYLYVKDGKLILICEIDDAYGSYIGIGEKIISEKESDINKYRTAYNLMQLYL